MSLAALLISVRSTVRTALSLSPQDCDCRDIGAPINVSFNQQFFAIHPTSWLPGDLDDINSPGGVNHEYGISVTITKKIGIVPADKQFDTLFLAGIASFEKQATIIINAVHQSQDVMGQANQLLSLSPFLIIEPLRWMGCDPAPVDRGSDWIGAAPSKNGKPVAQSFEIRFGRARRPVGIDPSLGQQYNSEFGEE